MPRRRAARLLTVQTCFSLNPVNSARDFDITSNPRFDGAMSKIAVIQLDTETLSFGAYASAAAVEVCSGSAG